MRRPSLAALPPSQQPVRHLSALGLRAPPRLHVAPRGPSAHSLVVTPRLPPPLRRVRGCGHPLSGARSRGSSSGRSTSASSRPRRLGHISARRRSSRPRSLASQIGACSRRVLTERTRLDWPRGLERAWTRHGRGHGALVNPPPPVRTHGRVRWSAPDGVSGAALWGRVAERNQIVIREGTARSGCVGVGCDGV